MRALLIKAFQNKEDFEDRYDAEVWLADMSNRMRRFVPKALPQEGERLEFLRVVHAEASKVGIRPELALAVINVESGFNRLAISRSGAFGYMQIMPFWLTEIGQGGDNPFQIRTNLRMGCVILSYYLGKEHQNYVRALGRYNGSYGKPDYPYLVLNLYNKRWFPN